jgi:hypothetical protein
MVSLSPARAAPYVVNFKVLDVNLDGKISRDGFEDGCRDGWVEPPSAVSRD